MYHHPDEDFLRKHNQTPPKFSTHGTEEDIKKKLKPLETTDWKLEGNKLICQTELGPVVQWIPTNKILVGVDGDGKPILQTIAL